MEEPLIQGVRVCKAAVAILHTRTSTIPLDGEPIWGLPERKMQVDGGKTSQRVPIAPCRSASG